MGVPGLLRLPYDVNSRKTETSRPTLSAPFSRASCSLRNSFCCLGVRPAFGVISVRCPFPSGHRLIVGIFSSRFDVGPRLAPTSQPAKESPAPLSRAIRFKALKSLLGSHFWFGENTAHSPAKDHRPVSRYASNARKDRLEASAACNPTASLCIVINVSLSLQHRHVPRDCLTLVPSRLSGAPYEWPAGGSAMHEGLPCPICRQRGQGTGVSAFPYRSSDGVCSMHRDSLPFSLRGADCTYSQTNQKFSLKVSTSLGTRSGFRPTQDLRGLTAMNC
jgi:hypothetical protein